MSQSDVEVEDVTPQNIAASLRAGVAIDLDTLEENGFYEVERLLAYDEASRTVRVKWAGYDDTTWEPVSLIAESMTTLEVVECIARSMQIGIWGALGELMNE